MSSLAFHVPRLTRSTFSSRPWDLMRENSSWSRYLSLAIFAAGSQPSSIGSIAVARRLPVLNTSRSASASSTAARIGPQRSASFDWSASRQSSQKLTTSAATPSSGSTALPTASVTLPSRLPARPSALPTPDVPAIAHPSAIPAKQIP